MVYEHPTVDALREGLGQNGVFKPSASTSHVVKIQLPMNASLTRADDSPEHVVAYNRMRTTAFLIQKGDNDAVQFDGLVQRIKTDGINRLKGYFAAYGVASEDNPDLPGMEVDLDVQCMMPPRPF